MRERLHFWASHVHEGTGAVRLSAEPEVAAHRAAEGLLRDRAMHPRGKLDVAWQLKEHAEPEQGALQGEFSIPSSKQFAPVTDAIPGWDAEKPLFDRQARALRRMVDVEAGAVDHIEEEYYDETLPHVGFSLQRARAPVAAARRRRVGRRDGRRQDGHRARARRRRQGGGDGGARGVDGVEPADDGGRRDGGGVPAPEGDARRRAADPPRAVGRRAQEVHRVVAQVRRHPQRRGAQEREGVGDAERRPHPRRLRPAGHRQGDGAGQGRAEGEGRLPLAPREDGGAGQGAPRPDARQQQRAPGGRRARRLRGIWLPGFGANPYAGTNGRQCDRHAAALFSTKYEEALAGLRGMSFKDDAKGVRSSTLCTSA